MFKDNSTRGFTLIELLVVIAIIGIMASVVLSAFGDVRQSARDVVRRADLKAIQFAMELYYQDYGTYQVVGGGFGGNGQGWFAMDSGSYPKSVSQVLYDAGYLTIRDIDDPMQNPGYIIYVCDGGNSYAVAATLEKPTSADEAGIQVSCNGVGPNGTYTRYGKNYAVTEP
jgi:prepilin-type N-terminal cleavage/methylation domain-containing protein